MIDALSLLPEHHEKQFDSRYRIVLVAAQRAKQIMQGDRRPGTSKFAKETSMALDEVLKDQVPFLVGTEARQAIKEGKRGAEHDFDPALLAQAQTDEVSQEIKKELSVYIDDTPKEPEPVVEEDSTEG